MILTHIKEDYTLYTVLAMIMFLGVYVVLIPNFMGFFMFVTSSMVLIILHNRVYVTFCRKCKESGGSKEEHAELKERVTKSQVLLLALMMSTTNIIMHDKGDNYIRELHNLIWRGYEPMQVKYLNSVTYSDGTHQSSERL